MGKKYNYKNANTHNNLPRCTLPGRQLVLFTFSILCFFSILLQPCYTACCLNLRLETKLAQFIRSNQSMTIPTFKRCALTRDQNQATVRKFTTKPELEVQHPFFFPTQFGMNVERALEITSHRVKEEEGVVGWDARRPPRVWRKQRIAFMLICFNNNKKIGPLAIL